MRTRFASILTSAVAVLLISGLAACGGDDGGDAIDARTDAPRPDAAEIDAAETDAAMIDAPSIDAPTDARIDAGTDAPDDASPTSSESIGYVKTAPDGAANLAIIAATVTYVRPLIGTDPAGFSVQAEQNGPAVLVAVDPSTLTPPPVVGDIVNFTVTNLATVSGQRRVTAISNFSRMSQGANVGALAQDLSASTNLVSAIDMYDAEIINLAGTISTAFINSGSGFESAQITTAGMTVADPTLIIRLPSTMRNANDLVPGCTFTLDNTLIQKFVSSGTPAVTAAEPSPYVAADIAVANCPAPVVVAAVATSATSVNVTFSRNIHPTTVMTDGTQFTFDNGLTASAASVSGRVVTVTTSVQVNGNMHIVTVANSITDTLGTALGTPSTAMFMAFMSPTHLVINEVDYDQTGTDATSFIEIYNPTPNPLPLANIAVQYINGGAGGGLGAEYGTRVSLSTAGATLNAGAYLVIKNTATTVTNSPLVIDVGTSDFLQNAAASGLASPDGLALINTSTNTLIDGFSYEGSITAATITGFTGTVSLVETTPFTIADPADDTSSLGRFPNGLDSNNAAGDWSVRNPKSPGATN